MGDTGSVDDACTRIRNRLSEAGIEQLIVGCANCKKIFDRHMTDFPVSYVIEILPEGLLKGSPLEKEIYLHHPCPLYYIEGARLKTEAVLRAGLGRAVDEQRRPACCGYGGSLDNQDSVLALKFTERVTMAAYGAEIVTSCMGSKNMFIRKGTPAYHILELITGVMPLKKALGPVRKWANRASLTKDG
jgi:Fe-S oxidoreductase